MLAKFFSMTFGSWFYWYVTHSGALMKKIVLNRVIVRETIYFKMKIDAKKFVKICKFEKLHKIFFANLKKIYYKTGSLTLKISCKKL